MEGLAVDRLRDAEGLKSFDAEFQAVAGLLGAAKGDAGVYGAVLVEPDRAFQNQHGAWLSALMLALAAVCLPCALHIWRHSRVAALHRVMVCAVAMVLLHGLLLAGSGAGGHAHAGVPTSNVAGASSAGGLLMVIALEITTALLAATLIARLRSVPHI